MNVSKFRVGDWLLVAGGAAMLVFGLALDWATIHAGGRNYGGALAPFDYPFTGGLAWMLTVAAGLVAFLLAGQLISPGRSPWTRWLLAATALSTLLMLVRLALGGGAGGHIGAEEFSLGRGAGMVIALLAAAVALGGAWHNFRAEGGSLADLQSLDAWRSTDRSADDAAEAEAEDSAALDPPR